MTAAPKTCAIMQPHYLPWLGYFEMIDRVDAFVFLDDAQLTRGEWKNRNRIRKTATAPEPKWLTVPIRRESHFAPINEALIADSKPWVDFHLASLRQVYGRAPCFDAVYPELARLIAAHRQGTLGDLNIALVAWICGFLGIATPLAMASGLGAPGRRQERVVNLCRAVGAGRYLGPNATAGYVEASYFEERGIGFAPQDYAHPVYRQSHKGRALPFLSHLSIVDLLFNHGPQSLAVIRQGRPGGTG